MFEHFGQARDRSTSALTGAPRDEDRAVLWWVDDGAFGTDYDGYYDGSALGWILSVSLTTLQYIFLANQSFVRGVKTAMVDAPDWEPVDRRSRVVSRGQLAPDLTILEADIKRLSMYEYHVLRAMLMRVAEYLEAADA